MRKVLKGLVFFLVVGLLAFSCSDATADGRDMYGERLRDSTIVVEFSFPEDVSGVVGFELWCIFIPGSATMEYVATLNDPTERMWELAPTELPIGINLPYYMKVLYDNDNSTSSTNAYMFALTTPPVLENVIKQSN